MEPSCFWGGLVARCGNKTRARLTLSYQYKEDTMNVAGSAEQFTDNDEYPTRLKGEERVSPRRDPVLWTK